MLEDYQEQSVRCHFNGNVFYCFRKILWRHFLGNTSLTLKQIMINAAENLIIEAEIVLATINKELERRHQHSTVSRTFPIKYLPLMDLIFS